MPFQSTSQMRFAFATKKPWAKRWADETPDIEGLPKKKRTSPRRKAVMKMLGKLTKH